MPGDLRTQRPDCTHHPDAEVAVRDPPWVEGERCPRNGPRWGERRGYRARPPPLLLTLFGENAEVNEGNNVPQYTPCTWWRSNTSAGSVRPTPGGAPTNRSRNGPRQQSTAPCSPGSGPSPNSSPGASGSPGASAWPSRPTDAPRSAACSGGPANVLWCPFRHTTPCWVSP